MKQSSERILTTHVGSLPRPPDLLEFLEAREAGRPIEQSAFDACLASAVRDVVEKQVAAGIDSVCDGEFGKISYTFYVATGSPESVPFAAATTTGHRRPRRIATSSSIPISRRGSTGSAAAPPGSAARRCRAVAGRSPIGIRGRSRSTLQTSPPPAPPPNRLKPS